MKKLLVSVMLICVIPLTWSQEWMSNLRFAKKLALDQNKMVLMLWEDAIIYPYPVLINNQEGNTIFIKDLFTDERIYGMLWDYFVPVLVDESIYDDWYSKLKGTRSQAYMDVFNDDSIKILDANGNIINIKQPLDRLQNLSDLISKYALNTEYLNKELRAYQKSNDFYTSYFLASKYLDYALFHNVLTRETLVNLSHVYSEEAMAIAITETNIHNIQRCQLLQIQEQLLLKRPKRALRQLRRLEKEGIAKPNDMLFAFISFCAHMAVNNVEEAQIWQTKISSVNLKKAQLIINLNKY